MAEKAGTGISSWTKGLKVKLLIVAILPVVGFIVSGIISVSSVGSIVALLHDAQSVIIPNLEVLGRMRGSRLNFNIEILSAIDHPETRTKVLVDAEKYLQEYKNAYEDYKNNPFIPGEAEIHESQKHYIDEVINLMSDLVKLLNSSEPENHEKAKALYYAKMNTVNHNVRVNFNEKLSQLYNEKVEVAKKEAKSTEHFVYTMLFATTICSTIIIFGLILLLASKIAGAVSNISTKLKDSSAQVAQAVSQIASSGNNLASTSTQAASSLEETVGSLEEITSMVRVGADNAKQAAELATRSSVAAGDGANEIQNLIKSMNQISSSSKKIEEIISVIDDIAFQTNLLALNAAVEAARAGEQGKGFAVVADAVRGLAQRSAASAKDISALIKDSVAEISTGSRIADKSGDILSGIVDSIKKVSDLNNEIATAIQEQASGIQQINTAMSQLDQSVQTNAAAAEQIAAASSEMSALADTSDGLTVELVDLILGSDNQKAS